MEKMKVTKEVFDSLKELELNYKDGEILDNLIYLIRKYTDNEKWVSVKYKGLNNLNLKEFMACLHYGYELEETKEEKFLSLYKYHKKIAEKNRVIENIYYVSGLKTAIDMLGLEEK